MITMVTRARGGRMRCASAGANRTDDGGGCRRGRRRATHAAAAVSGQRAARARC